MEKQIRNQIRNLMAEPNPRVDVPDQVRETEKETERNLDQNLLKLLRSMWIT